MITYTYKGILAEILKLSASCYFSEEEFKDKLNTQSNNLSFSILHINIRSMNKNFENFKLSLSQCSQEFSMVCLTETWNSDESFQNNSNFQLPQYSSVHFGRKNKRGGGICIFITKGRVTLNNIHKNN